ncbi:hypothetical protein [Streptomyces bobili]
MTTEAVTEYGGHRLIVHALHAALHGDLGPVHRAVPPKASA